MPDHEEAGQHRGRCYGRESVEFGRLLGVSGSVFGIAMTLLVFTLDASAVRLDGFAGVLADQTGELIAPRGELRGHRQLLVGASPALRLARAG